MVDQRNRKDDLLDKIYNFFRKICISSIDKSDQDNCFCYDSNASLREISVDEWQLISHQRDRRDCLICLEIIDENIKYSLKCPHCGIIPNIHYSCWLQWILCHKKEVCCYCKENYNTDTNLLNV